MGALQEESEAALRLHDGEWRNGTIYTSVTSNLPKRAFEHRERRVGLQRNTQHARSVELTTMLEAAEKQIKAGSRQANWH